jgi:hypothetical protein
MSWNLKALHEVLSRPLELQAVEKEMIFDIIFRKADWAKRSLSSVGPEYVGRWPDLMWFKRGIL